MLVQRALAIAPASRQIQKQAEPKVVKAIPTLMEHHPRVTQPRDRKAQAQKVQAQKVQAPKAPAIVPASQRVQKRVEPKGVKAMPTPAGRHLKRRRQNQPRRQKQPQRQKQRLLHHPLPLLARDLLPQLDRNQGQQRNHLLSQLHQHLL